MLRIYHILLRQSSQKYEIRKLTIKYKSKGKKATISSNCMIQGRSRGLDLFMMTTCLGYMHYTGRLKVPTRMRGRVHWIFPLTGTWTCTWSCVKVDRNCIHMTYAFSCSIDNFVGWYHVYQWKIRWARRVQNQCRKFSTYAMNFVP